MADQPPPRGQKKKEGPDHWKKFFVVQTGKIIRPQKSVLKTFKSVGHTEALSPEDADYCLVFCPVVSRVGTDVDEALDHLLSGKEAVLVVMHQTFNPQQVIPPSSRLVEDQRVLLTVDCMFYQEKLLKCQFNTDMTTTIKKFFKVSDSKVPGSLDHLVLVHSDGTKNHQGVPSLQSPDDTKSSVWKIFSRLTKQQQDDSSLDIKKALNDLTGALKKMEDDIKSLKDEQDKEKQKLENKIEELEKSVAELKQHCGLHVEPGSSGGLDPTVNEEPGSLKKPSPGPGVNEEPGSVNHSTTTSF